MKKIISIVAIILSMAVLSGLTACESKTKTASSNATSTKETIKLKVGVCPGPYGDLFKKAISPQLEAKGYKFEFVEFSDYVQPNNALANKETELNIFQHSTYLANFSKEHNLKLSVLTEIPTVGMGVWSNKVKGFNELKQGATVTIPNDETNLARSLRVLQAAGLIKLKANANPAKATVADIDKNEKGLKFTAVEAAQVPRTLDSTDLAVVNGNFAISAGLNPSASIYNEVLGDGYVNVIAVRTEDLDKQFAKDIKDAATNAEFKKFINDPKNGFSGFQKPKGW